MARAAVLVVVMLLVPQVRADDPAKEKQRPSAFELLAGGLEKAEKEKKSVFLVFGSPTCGWCKYFDKYHADAEVEKVIGKYFVLVKVDIATDRFGRMVYKLFGRDRGVPAWTIVASDLKWLGDSGDEEDNVGFPYEDKEVEHYVKSVRAAAPKMTDAEAQLLVKKLRDIGPKKEKHEDKKDK